MRLLRKRLIPKETLELDKDKVLFCDDEFLVTEWMAIRPKIDLHHGISCYFLKEGFKVSKFYREDNSLIYWYCDIIWLDHDKDKDTYLFTDLLADVIVCTDGAVKVVDMDELATAFEGGAIDSQTLCQCLYRLDNLLKIIYDGQFFKLQEQLEKWEHR